MRNMQQSTAVVCVYAARRAELESHSAAARHTVRVQLLAERLARQYPTLTPHAAWTKASSMLRASARTVHAQFSGL